MRITLKGRIPSKKNSRITLYRKGRVFNFPSNQYQKWHKEQVEVIKELEIKTHTLCSLVMTFFLPDKRRTDLSNKGESVLDLLTDTEVIKDDNWTCVNSIHYISGGVDKVDPRVEIDIIDLSVDSIS